MSLLLTDNAPTRNGQLKWQVRGITLDGAAGVAGAWFIQTVCVCLSVCGNFFPTNPYLLAGLTDLDEIWHDGRS